SKKKIRDIAREVNVQYVLEGSVRKAGNDLRITAQLIDGINDSHLWAEKYKGTLDDVFDIQEKVSRSIVDAMQLKLTPQENIKLAEHLIDNVQAYELHLKARYEIMLLTENHLSRALQLLKNGLKIIGENEILYADLGQVYLCYYEFISKEDKSYFDKAEDCVKKVFTLNHESSHGHALKGNLNLRQGNIQNGIKEFRRALEIDPNEQISLFRLGWIYALSGKENGAKSLFNKLLEIDPLTPINHLILGALEVVEGRFNSGLEHIIRAHELEPENPLIRYWYAKCLAYDQRYEEAYQLFDIIEKDTNISLFANLGAFFKYALQGKKEAALKSVTEDLKSVVKEDEMYPIWMAESYALIGEKEEAIDWLECGINYGFIHYLWLSEYNPFLENIRGESRFKKLMERVKKELENFEA
ncbi:MAG: tetratricopeptide repeat protein, partial [Cyclobacteriaceae bacterium]|nr:tetratricopeptide repeat protein [Cyclobacteriaceae bacterium]